jgi:WD40 repeat protein
MEAMGGGEEFRDFLISYTAADVERARWINRAVKSAGYTSFFQEEDFTAGDDRAAWIDHVVGHVERTIVVLSPAYLQSVYGAPEWRSAWDADPDGRRGKLIVVKVADCEPGGLLKQRPGIDLVGVTDEEQFRRVLISKIEDVVRGGAIGLRQPSPSSDAAAWQALPPAQAAELDPHFDRGTTVFIGRGAALLNLARWLRDPSDVDPRVVVGGPGSGKTALLGLLASYVGGGVRPATRGLLDLPDDELPPSESIDVAIYAGGMQAHEVLATVAAAAGVPAGQVGRIRNGAIGCADGLSELLGRLSDGDRPLVALIDGLDEAAFPTQLTSEVLRPLLVEPYRGRIRLLLGTRPNIADDLGFRSEAGGDLIVNLDRPPYADVMALRQVVLRTLIGEAGQGLADVAESVWLNAPSAVRGEAVDVIVGLTAPSFYAAQAVASAQARLPELPDPHDPDWKADLPRGGVDAMRHDLQARLGDHADRAADLLLPLAYARGEGLPRTYLWWDLANALAGGRSYGNGDLRWLWEKAASYLVQTETAANDPRDRLYHRLLADCLKAGRVERDDERTVTRVLLRHLRRDANDLREWANAAPYTRHHLIEHAVAAGLADDLILDPGFLLNAGSAELRASLDKLDDGRQLSAPLRAAADAYRDALPMLDSCLDAERPSYLLLAARSRQADTLAERIGPGGINAPWQTVWTSWRRQAAHRRILAQRQRVRAVAVAHIGGATLVMAAGDDDVIRVFDLASGQESEPLHGHDAAVGALAVGQARDGAVVVASASDDSTVMVWDLASRRPYGAPFTGHNDWVRAVAFADYEGRIAVVSGGDDAKVWIWDLATGEPIGEAFIAHKAPVVAVAAVPLPGLDDSLIVSASEDGEVLVWPLEDDEAKPAAYLGHRRTVGALAVTTLDGAPAVVSGSDDRSIQVWNPLTLEQFTAPLTGHADRVRAVTIARVGPDARQVVVSGSDDATSRVWDLAAGLPLGAPIAVHADAVRALAFVEHHRRPMMISGSADGTVREWGLSLGGAVGEPFAGHTRPIRALAMADVAGEHRLISGGADGKVRLWDPGSGYPVGPELTGHTNWVGAVAVATVADQLRIVSASGDTTARIWNPADGQMIGPTFHAKGWIGALAVVNLDGSDAVIVAGADHDDPADPDAEHVSERPYVARVWDPADDAPIATYVGHSGWIRALAVADADGKPVVVSGGDDGTLHVWDPKTGEPEPTQLAARHEGAVRAIAVDGHHIISAGDDDKIRVCELGHNLVGLAWEANSGGVTALAVSKPPDTEPVVISAGIDGCVRFWSIASGLPLGSQSAHYGAARALAVAAIRGQQVVFSAGDDAMIRAWDVETRSSHMSVHSDWVRCVAVAETAGQRPMVVSGSDDATIGIWDLSLGTPYGTRLTGHRSAVRAVTTARLDGTPIVVSGGIDGTIRIWDLAAGRAVLPAIRAHTDWVRSVAVSALPSDRQVIVACGDDAAITMWDLETGAALGAARTGHSRGVRALAITGPPGARVVVSGGADGNVRRVQLANGLPGGELIGTHRRGISAMAAVELSGRQAVVCGDGGGEVTTWDVQAGESLGADSYGANEIGAIAAAVPPRRRGSIGRPLLAVATGATLTLSTWQPEAGWRPLVKPMLNSEILAAAFTGNGQRIVLGTQLGIVVIDFARYLSGQVVSYT